MTSNTRLRVCALVIIFSVMYAVLVAQDASIASAVALGYVALVLTAIITTNVWKKP